MRKKILKYLTLPLLIGAGLLGRIMGGWTKLKILKKIDAFILGIVYGLILLPFTEWLSILLIGLGCWLGEKPGVGWPKGYIDRGVRPDSWKPTAKREWYIPKVLEDEPYLSLAIRGFLWGFPMTLLGSLGGLSNWPILLILTPLFIISLPLAIFIGKYMPKIKILGATSAWPWSEIWQQIIVMAGILTFVTIL